MADDGWSLEELDRGDDELRDGERVGAGRVGAGRVGRLAILLAIAVGVVSFAVPDDPGPGRDGERSGGRPAPQPAVVGRSLTVVATLRVPPGLGTVSDGAYIALRTVDGRAEVAVTAPSQVAEGAGRYAAMPEDPAAWLRRHPGVRVTRVGGLAVAGRGATQVDYEFATDPRSRARAQAVPLFCGWPPDPGRRGEASAPCTALSPTERVRATFVPIANQVLMIEASWTPTGSRMPGERPSSQIPEALLRTYDALLAGTSLPVPGGGPVSHALPG